MNILSVGNQIASAFPISDNIPTSNTTQQFTKTTTPIESNNPVTLPDQIPKTPTFEQVTKAVQDINKAIQATSQGLELSVDKTSHEVIVKLIDQQTRQVLRQIPTQEALEIAKSLDKLQGLLITQTA